MGVCRFLLLGVVLIFYSSAFSSVPEFSFKDLSCSRMLKKADRLSKAQLLAIKDEMKEAYKSRLDFGVTGFDVGEQSLIVYIVNSSVIEFLTHDIAPQFKGVPVKFFVNPKPPKFDLDSINSICEEFGLNSFVVSGVDAFPSYPIAETNDFSTEFRHGDYCWTAAEEIPEPLLRTLGQLKQLTEKSAALFELSATDFIRPKMSITIRGNQVGPLNSTSNISLGVFPNWPGGDINSGIYVHELGHYIFSNKNKKLPLAMGRLKSYKLFVEGVADWLALNVVGQLPSHDGGLTGPLLNLRDFNNVSTFAAPSGYFKGTYAFQHLKESIEANPTPGDSIEAQNERMVYQAIASKFPNLPEIDQTPLLELKEANDLDAHQLGIPINAFFMTLKEKLGRSLVSEFLQALRMNSEANRFDPQFECTIEGLETPDADKVFVTMPTVSGFLNRIKSLLKAEEQQVFENAWAQHGLDIGLKLEEGKAVERFVDWAAKDVMRERFRANDGQGSGVYNPANKCYSKDYGIDMNCVLTCVQIGT